MSYFERFHVVPMPTDRVGRGPVRRSEAVHMTWEVWDGGTNLSLASFDSPDRARSFAERANDQLAVSAYLEKLAE